jgi:hypothetical protein
MEALKIKKEIGDTQGLRVTLLNLGGSYFEAGKNVEALYYLCYSLALSNQMHVDQMPAMSYLVPLRAKLGMEKFKKLTNEAYIKIPVDIRNFIPLKELFQLPVTVPAKRDRNDKVKVKYIDGTVKEVKYKKIALDIESGNCEIISD